jgi:transcriptional regulator with GAF, ATPase, and Fis domain
VHQDDLDRVNQQMKEIFNNKSVFDVNFRIMRPNNEVRYIDSSASPVFINGHLEKIIGINRDITERKTSEKELENALHQLTELKQQIEAENIYLKEELKLEGSYDEIVGASKSLSKVLKQVEQVAKTDSTVLVLGETGTGKELIALAVHDASDRKNKPLVKVNCSALPSDLIESELFGHEKGAFTGAINRKIGRFELANGGTIFLDEIGDLPIDLQTRLLRVLQESEFERLGGETTIKVDVRVIAATNRNLEKRVLENKFRQDLYYRLNVFPIKCPPLRDRLGDIPSLVNHFVNKYNHKVNHKIKTVNQKTIERLIQYNWPGNIRELEHVIERAVIINQGKQLRLGNWFADSSTQNVVSDELSTLEVMERNHIKKVLEKTNWKIRGRQGAAEILGLKPTTLESRMKKLMIIRST